MKDHFNYRVTALLLAASCCGFAAQAQAQPAPATPTVGTLQQFLSGDLVPLDLKFSQMKTGWSRVNIERKGETKSATAPAFVPPDAVELSFRKYFGKGSDIVLTPGRTVDLGGEPQLVIYRAEFPGDREIGSWFESHFTAEMKAVQSDKEKFMRLALPLTRQFLDTVPLRASLINVP